MKKLIVLTAALALVACSERSETTVEAAPTATAMAEAPSPAANQSATGSMPGRYEISMADGSVMTETINTDGTYVDLMDGKETRGRWRMDGARSCFDPDGAEPEICYTSTAPKPDGSFTVTRPDGITATVRKIGSAATPAPTM